MKTVTLSLISHTNVGKTTLARTLLRRDVGEVFDQAHVTEVSEAFPLIETDEARLLLWDTPGFGDTARLARRLKQEEKPVGWFLHQVWDRVTDRPLWCSQEALRNVREDADVVLYLVNAAEDPEHAGYVRHELDILTWVGRPVMVLLNQTGGAGEHAELTATWKRALASWDVVREILSLDAFTRSWVQEDRLFERVIPILPEESRGTMRALAAAWRARNLEVYQRSLTRLAEHLAAAALEREPLSSSAGRGDKKRAMQSLTQRLERRELALWDETVAAHGLEGRGAAEVKAHLDDFVVEGTELASPRRGALIGGALSGAFGGLLADLLSGGLTFGGGLVAGTVLGALGGAGLTRAVEWIRSSEEPRITWSSEFLDALTGQTVLRYLAVAHFGRGRGEFHDIGETTWEDAVREALAESRPRLARLWTRAHDEDTDWAEELRAALEKELGRVVGGLLERAYPGARVS